MIYIMTLPVALSVFLRTRLREEAERRLACKPLAAVPWPPPSGSSGPFVRAEGEARELRQDWEADRLDISIPSKFMRGVLLPKA